MALAQLNVTYEDVAGKRGVFGLLVDDVYNDGVFAEITAVLNAFLLASQAKIVKATIARELDVSGLTGNTAASTGSFDRIDDQAILSFTSASGLIVKVSIPAPVDGLFQASGAWMMQEVDWDGTEGTALEAALLTTPVLAARTEDAITYRKGWRKGQKHP